MAMFEEIGGFFASDERLTALADAFDTNPGSALTVVSAGIPMLLGGLAKRTSTPNGAESLFRTVQDNDGAVLDNIDRLIASPDGNGLGASLVGAILGGRRSAVESALGASATLPPHTVTVLLATVAPAVVAFLGRRQTADNLDRDGLVSALAQERVELEDNGYPEWLALLEGGDPLDDDKGFQSGLAKIVGLGGLGTLTAPAAIAPLPEIAQLTETAPSGIARPAAGIGSAPGNPMVSMPITDPSTPVVRSTTTVTEDRFALLEEPAESRGPDALKWLLPALLAVVFAALLVGCLNDRGSDDAVQTDTSAQSDATAEADVGATAVEELPTEVPTEVPTELPEPTPEPEPTAVPAPEPVVFTPGYLLDTAESSATFTNLLALIDDAGLSQTLDGDGPFTMLAPIDAAFEVLPVSVRDLILSDPEALDQLLRFHVIADDAPLSGSATGALTTLEGSEIFVDTEGFQPKVNGATVLDSDIAAGNGLLQVIDRVLLPPTLIDRAGITINEALSLEPISFFAGGVEVPDEGKLILDSVVVYLRSTDVRIEIGGHTDSDGDDNRNLELSQQRADAVMNYLVENGIDADRLVAMGYGEVNPVMSNDNQTGKEANRRIEFTVLG